MRGVDLSKQLSPCYACGAKPKIVCKGFWFHVVCKCGVCVDQERVSPFDAALDWNFMADAMSKARAHDQQQGEA